MDSLSYSASVARLFDSARQGDQKSVADFLEHMRPQVLATCYRIIGNLDDAEDATQEALIDILEDMHAPSHDESWHAAVYRNTVAASLQSIRNSYAEMAARPSNGENHKSATVSYEQVQPFLTTKFSLDRIDELERSPHRVVATRESIGLVFVKVLQTLSPMTRAVYILKDVLGCSDETTAEATHLGATEVADNLKSARMVVDLARTKMPQDTLLPSHPEAVKVIQRFSKCLASKDVMEIVDVFEENAVLVVPPIGPYFGQEAIAAQFARIFEVGMAPDATVEVEINGQSGLVCFQKRMDRRGTFVRFHPFMLMVIAVADKLPSQSRIVRLDLITDMKHVKKIASSVPKPKRIAVS